jgi:hypothetical protein
MISTALVTAGITLALMTGNGPKNTVEVRSKRDGKIYKVQNLPDKQEACEYIAKLSETLSGFMNTYKHDVSAMTDPRVKTMLARFNPDNFSENDLTADTTSYSENKGEKIVVCIREKTPPYTFVDENTVMFVLLHEMAHLMTTTIGHTPEFWANFKRILHDAIQAGIYTPINYSKHPVLYCGMTITDSPL